MPKLYRLPAGERIDLVERSTGTYVTAIEDCHRDGSVLRRWTGTLVAVAYTNSGTAEVAVVHHRPGYRAIALSLATLAEVRPATNAELVASGFVDDVLAGRSLVERKAIVVEALDIVELDDVRAKLDAVLDDLLIAQVEAAKTAARAVR